MPPISGMVRE
ncbi:unnamed protein product [Chondrus crispus]|uniref:Uncharacterized protein n=1 Tax=Chondrus crispus TaxID=2769 RepID=R7QAK4_CHOCR|nr:unnamed protein product [Chondrus crispus]CDF34833.1 unnamed protein product [Chondrus crispus]|eukprot:XP_005714652.1 unnamed protein product [Chondrus crispus]